MNTSSPGFHFLSLRPFLILWVILLSGPTMEGQVAALYHIDRDYVSEGHVVNVTWMKSDEDSWHKENEGRLDLMGLRLGLTSEQLQVQKSDRFSIHLPGHESGRIECLIRIQQWSPEDQLVLSDIPSGKVIFTIDASSPGEVLTPSFDPDQTVWNWKSKNKKASSFRVDNLYYDSGQDDSRGIGFNTAMPCHPNAACKTDSLLALISNSAVRLRMVMDEGIGWCSGSLVNNTRNDKTPLLLTAFHCQWNYTPLYNMWRFDFQYKSDSCQNPTKEPVYFSLTGCVLLSSGQASDYLLVRLNDKIPGNQEVTFAGWDRNPDTTPDTTYLVHHPNADIRKFSTCSDKAVVHPNQINWSEGYSTPANHHFRVKFTEGGHEPGSSGGPVFNQDGHLVGQLHGGTAGCELQNTAFIGRLAKSWSLGTTPSTRLRDWLDPDSTGVLQLEAIENISSGDIVDIRGVVLDPLDRPVRHVTVHVSGGANLDVTTDAFGKFAINGVDRNVSFTLTPEKDEMPSNGLNIQDPIAIQKHSLGIQKFDQNWQFIAADVTNNGAVTVGDIVQIMRLLLGKTTYFPSSTSWRFDPPALTFQDIPPGAPYEVQFMGIKIGDVNASADPGK